MNKLICKASLLILSVIPFVSSIGNLSAQNLTQQEMIEDTGPYADIWEPQALEMTLKSWEWKSMLLERQQELILQESRKWQSEVDRYQSELSAIEAVTRSAGTNYPIDPRFNQQSAERIDELKSQLVAVDAARNQLQIEANHNVKQLEIGLEEKEAEISLYKVRLEHAMEKHEHFRAMFESGDTEKVNVAQAKTEVVAMEQQIRSLLLQIKSIRDQIDNGTSSQLAALSEQRNSIKNQIAEIEKARKTILESDVLNKQAEVDARIKFARRMIDMAEVRRFELQLENTRNQALIELARELTEPGKTANSQSGDNDKRP